MVADPLWCLNDGRCGRPRRNQLDWHGPAPHPARGPTAAQKLSGVVVVTGRVRTASPRLLGWGTVAHLRVDFHSEALRLSTSMTVILPQATTNQIGMTGATRKGDPPVLWLLHGLSDDDTIWVRRTSIERYVAPLGLAVIMPQVHRSFYSDEVLGGAPTGRSFPRNCPRRSTHSSGSPAHGGHLSGRPVDGRVRRLQARPAPAGPVRGGVEAQVVRGQIEHAGQACRTTARTLPVGSHDGSLAATSLGPRMTSSTHWNDPTRPRCPPSTHIEPPRRVRRLTGVRPPPAA
jgi:hypothetical protein